MFFIISKVLSFLLNPIIWVFILLIFVLFLKNQKKKKKWLFITLGIIYFFSNSFIIAELYRLWEIKPTKTEDLLPYYDVGVVLGGGMATYDSEYDRLTFRHNPDRIMQAVYLYNEHKIGKILISGGSGSLIFRDMRESVLLKDFLVSTLHLPENDILIDSISDNTYQNALQSKYILNEQFSEPKVLLITSAFHMRRSIMCFRKQGINVTPYATNLNAGPRRYHIDHLLIPSLWSMGMWSALLHEIIGIGTYKVMGYI
ncbi:MAG: YdcF family protein [Bacteroidales bacterium]|nr:YdcF family protein [Bacteroidales bacterium]